MSRLALFGPGYCGSRIADALAGRGWIVEAIGRATPAGAARDAIGRATHLISTVPPQGEADPVLSTHRAAITARPGLWLGYLSSTGVYGDTGGAWVDESAPLAGRRGGRMAADCAWQALGACVLRLPGIYGPGRSMLDRLAAGQAHRIELPGQVFSRIHVDDIVAGVLAAIACDAAGVYNLADDLPAPQNILVETACALLGRAPPPLVGLAAAGLSPAARAFYAENRRVANGRATRVLGWRPRYPDYRAGLAACLAAQSAAIASASALTSSRGLAQCVTSRISPSAQW